MRKRTYFISMVLLLVTVISSTVFPQLKKRVAVFTFEDKTDKSWRWWDGRHPGDGMADMLTTDLVKSGEYVVIERQELSKVLSEQKLGQAGLVTPESAAQMGKLLGVELAIMGAVTEFGHSKSGTGGAIKGFGIGVQKQKATVAVDIRFVNTTTGEIIAAENVRKEKSTGGLKINTSKFRFNNRNEFDNSLVGKATREAIDEISELVGNQMSQLPWEGKVILVKGGVVYIKPGSDAGVRVGDQFTIYSKGEELIDPDTGISLGAEEEKVGAIQISGIISGGKAAKATVKMGGGFKKGDLVRIP